MKPISEMTVCEQCPRIDSQRDIVFVSGKKRCPLCGRRTSALVLSKKNGKGKDVTRFPRTVKADKRQQEVIDLITSRCKDFDCPGKVVSVRVGPVVTEYILAPDRFTRVKKLKGLSEDLALAMKTDSVAVRRIAGQAAMGIAVPNDDRKTIMFSDCLKNVIAHKDDMELPLNMGVTSDGEPYVEDLATYPHLLIAGSTGAGKSVFLKNILTSLLYVRSPKQMQLVLIDPKSVELFPYKGLPHLIHEPVNDVYRALGTLDEIEQEMRRRTNNLHILKADNIKSLNTRLKAEAALLRKNGQAEAALRKESECWPYIVVVIDEMADMILAEKKMFTTKLATIAQMARAAGICIISATQRPSVDILPGKIKVNFPARAAFRVPSAADSKTVLNYKGADCLLGKGDMYLISPHKSGLQRIHVPLITDEDRDHLLRISLEYGHVNRVPADAIGKEEPVIPNGKTNGKSAVSKTIN